MRNTRGEDIKSILIKLASPEQMLKGVVRVDTKHQEEKDVFFRSHKEGDTPTNQNSIDEHYTRAMIDGSGRTKNKTSLQCLTIL